MAHRQAPASESASKKNQSESEMNKPNLYHRANGVQRRDAKEILDEHGHLLRWRENDEDSLLDIGCGSGDVLIDFVIPIAPQKRARVLGTDISEQMVRFARKVHSNVDNIFFDTLDIGGDISLFLNKWGCFDHITSFYCLHWVRCQRLVDRVQYNQCCLQKQDLKLDFYSKRGT